MRSARAALDGAPSPDASLGASAGRLRRLVASRPGRGALSLRHAAHMVTLSIVLVVILSASGLGSMVTQPAVGGAQLGMRRAFSIDLQVQREIGLAPTSGEAEAAQPAVQMPDLQALPAFTDTHEVQPGETLGSIAAEYEISPASLFWANDLGSGNVFAVGQELRIPRVSGVPYVIAEGDTLDSIAAKLSVRPQAIMLFKANALDAAVALPVGREIFVPGGSLALSDDLGARFGSDADLAGLEAVAAGTVRESETNLRSGPGRSYPKLGVLDAGRRLKLVARHQQWVKVEDAAGQLGWVRADLLGLSEDMISGLAETNDFPPPPPVWIWPTTGEITSRFGWRSAPYRSYHDGLDIANSAWTKIYAARTGRVSEAGWCSGFGYCVKIDHGDGVTSIYGHMIKKPPVRAGDQVEVGDLIGYMGSTYDRSGGGYSTGVHLHFTVKVNGKAVNPLKFLP